MQVASAFGVAGGVRSSFVVRQLLSASRTSSVILTLSPSSEYSVAGLSLSPSIPFPLADPALRSSIPVVDPFVEQKPFAVRVVRRSLTARAYRRPSFPSTEVGNRWVRLAGCSSVFFSRPPLPLFGFGWFKVSFLVLLGCSWLGTVTH